MKKENITIYHSSILPFTNQPRNKNNQKENYGVLF